MGKESRGGEQLRKGHFQYERGSEHLLKIGPVVFGRCLAPQALLCELAARGVPPPAPVVGVYLVDTGSDKSGISEKAAKALSLNVLPRKGHTRSAGGCIVEFNRYSAAIELTLLDGGEETSMILEGSFAGIPDFEKQCTSTAEGEAIGLLGSAQK